MKGLFAWFQFYHCATRLAIAIAQFCGESCIFFGYSTGLVTIHIYHAYSESKIKVVVAESEPVLAQAFTLFSRDRPCVRSNVGTDHEKHLSDADHDDD